VTQTWKSMVGKGVWMHYVTKAFYIVSKTTHLLFTKLSHGLCKIVFSYKYNHHIYCLLFGFRFSYNW